MLTLKQSVLEVQITVVRNDEYQSDLVVIDDDNSPITPRIAKITKILYPDWELDE